jgi:hypothetical protein
MPRLLMTSPQRAADPLLFLAVGPLSDGRNPLLPKIACSARYEFLNIRGLFHAFGHLDENINSIYLIRLLIAGGSDCTWICCILYL